MNFFADQLSRELDALGTPRSELAARFEVSASNLSQFCSGKVICGPKQLSRILRHLDGDSRLRLAAAWLKDQIPHEIDATKLLIAISDCRANESFEWPDTDGELREALVKLIKKANRHPEVRSTMIGLARLLSK